MTEEEITEEEIRKRFDPILARAGKEMQRRMKERRKELLQKSLEWMREAEVPPDRMLSDEWWEYIPDFDFDKRRHWLTGLYISPPEESEVVVCKDHPFVDPWMREEGVFGIVLSVRPGPRIIARHTNGEPIIGKDGKEVRMPGISRVEVAFPEDDYDGGLFLPANCIEMREHYESEEEDDEIT